MGLDLPMIGSLATIRDFASAVHQGSKHFFLHGGALEPGGTGPYAPASYRTHPSLPGHTIFAPDDLRAPRENEADGGIGGERKRKKLPVLVWANGLGLAWGLMFGAFLREIASHGYIVVASGPPGDEGGCAWWRRLRRVDERAMVDAVRWAVAAADMDTDAEGQGEEEVEVEEDIRAYVDGTRIALAGQSRGGMDAYAAAAELRENEDGESERVRLVMLFSAGLFLRASEARAAQVRGLSSTTSSSVPVVVVYVAGGAADVGRQAAERDWAELLPGSVPAWMGTLEGVGHGGTFWDDEDGDGPDGRGGGRGGRFVNVALDWLGWVLGGDEGARERLLGRGGGYYEREGWVVRMRNL